MGPCLLRVVWPSLPPPGHGLHLQALVRGRGGQRALRALHRPGWARGGLVHRHRHERPRVQDRARQGHGRGRRALRHVPELRLPGGGAHGPSGDAAPGGDAGGHPERGRGDGGCLHARGHPGLLRLGQRGQGQGPGEHDVRGQRRQAALHDGGHPAVRGGDFQPLRDAAHYPELHLPGRGVRRGLRLLAAPAPGAAGHGAVAGHQLALFW
mmetsp:Transcript_80317/g.260164  ORF Transcript_80317/g.260164 Transcript_80317/m.260164 type:complete len:210 (-) Transcript_80317:380-1009(-)